MGLETTPDTKSSTKEVQRSTSSLTLHGVRLFNITDEVEHETICGIFTTRRQSESDFRTPRRLRYDVLQKRSINEILCCDAHDLRLSISQHVAYEQDMCTI